MSSIRALRVGVLLGDQLVEERLFRTAAPVTFGRSLRCTLSVPVDGAPREHALFVRHGRGWAIRPLDGSADQPIPTDGHGKLRVGDATLLYQEVAAPAVLPRPTLPASLRNSLADHVDRRVAAIVGGSLVVHFGLAVWAHVTELETPPTIATAHATSYRHDTYSIELPDEPVVIGDGQPGAAPPVSPVQTPAPIVEPPRVTTTTPRPASKPAVTADDGARLAALLTGGTTGPRGGQDLHVRQPGADLDAQIRAVGDRPVTIGDTNGGGFRDPSRPQVITRPGTIADAPTTITTQPRPTEEPTGGRITIRPTPTGDPGTTLTVDTVLAKINASYMTGLQRCYKQGLVGDASLSGKVAVRLTVTERGTVEDATASGVEATVDRCIEGLMQGWRFPVPRDEDKAPTDASFKLSLALQPS